MTNRREGFNPLFYCLKLSHYNYFPIFNNFQKLTEISKVSQTFYNLKIEEQIIVLL